MKHRIICVLLLFVFCVSASNLHAIDIVLKDIGEVAFNNTNPTDGDNVTTGGWTLEKGAALGPYYGIYSSGAAYEGSLGIQLMGHGANIMSPSFSISLGSVTGAGSVTVSRRVLVPQLHAANINSNPN